MCIRDRSVGRVCELWGAVFSLPLKVILIRGMSARIQEPEGLVSTHLHDRVAVNDVIQVSN
eukprot:4322417-Amphidinium_carterae.1